jgi:L-ascorbate metabolism protein UlaG (beta-lactamase superfamily)
MPTEITFLGHASFQIKIGDHTILLDPFLTDNPAAAAKADELEADFILISHGHFDHVADVATIANRTNATIVGCFEITEWFQKNHEVENAVGMNIGGGVNLPFGRAKMTPAIHSSQLPDGSYGGNPSGFLLTLADGNVYFACDTALFSDMQLIGRAGLDLAVLPIGDHFTMGPDDAVEAVKLLQPRRVVPCHYNTWPPIEQDVEGWAEKVRGETNTEPIVLAPGASLTL